MTVEFADARTIHTPNEFLLRLKRLYGRERRDLARHLGNPADIRNVPASVWRKIRDDERAAMLLLIAGFGSVMLDQWHESLQESLEAEIPRRHMERRFMVRSRKRSDFVAKSVVRTTKRRLRKILQDVKQSGARRGKADILDEVISESRAETVTRTELSAARGAAAMAAYEASKTLGLDVHAVWSMRPCRHCRTCPELHRTDETFWGRFVDSPPLHINCCCAIEIVTGDRDDLVHEGVIREGDLRATIDAMTEDRIQVPAASRL